MSRGRTIQQIAMDLNETTAAQESKMPEPDEQDRNGIPISKADLKRHALQKNAQLRLLRMAEMEISCATELNEAELENATETSHEFISATPCITREPHPDDSHTSIPWSIELRDMFAQAHDLAGERFVKTERLVWLEDRIEKCPKALDWDLANIDGLLCRLNGQHTLILSLLYPHLFAGRVWVNLGIYCCKHLDEAILLYEQMDPPGSKRNSNEILGPTAVRNKILLPNKQISSLASAVNMAKTKQVASLTPDQRKMVVSEEQAFFRWYGQKIGIHANKGNQYVNRLGLAAVIFMAYKVDPDKCEGFLTETMNGGTGTIKDGDPCRILHEYCKNHKGASTSGLQPHLPLVGTTINCWNAWNRREPLFASKSRMNGRLPNMVGMYYNTKKYTGCLTPEHFLVLDAIFEDKKPKPEPKK